MKRRDATRLLGGAVAAWPFAAEAQQPAMPIIGFLHSGSPEQNVKRLAAFRKGLNTAGFVEGKNVAIDFRWAAGQNPRLPELAAELIAQRVAVITAPSSTPAPIPPPPPPNPLPTSFPTPHPPA